MYCSVSGRVHNNIRQNVSDRMRVDVVVSEKKIRADVLEHIKNNSYKFSVMYKTSRPNIEKKKKKND